MIYLPSIYTVIDQQKNYYCAASCVKSTLNYINGSSESLSAIYANLQGTGQIQPGVALSRIAPYLNEEQNETVYVTRDYGAANLSNGEDDLVVLSSHGKNFFILDTLQEKLYVSPCVNLEDGTEEHIFQVAQDGSNIVYATSEPISKRRSYFYTNLDVLMENRSSTVDLSGEAVDISDKASYPVPANYADESHLIY